MANKALAKRQKLSFRVEPSQKTLKPRKPVSLAAKQRSAHAHQQTPPAQRQEQNRARGNRLTARDKNKS
jgi:hypothetical protein